MQRFTYEELKNALIDNISSYVNLNNRETLRIGDSFVLIADILELIEYQQLEIERLQKYHDVMDSAIYQFREDRAKVKFFKDEIRAEAVKEFTENLKARIRDNMFAYPAEEHCERIDNLVKEMMGDAE